MNRQGGAREERGIPEGQWESNTFVMKGSNVLYTN